MLPRLPFVTNETQLKEAWRKHRRVLVERYGVSKALWIINGWDDDANEDRAKWYRLGAQGS